MNPWISAVIAIAGGFFLGSIAGRVVRRQMGSPNRPEALRQVAAPAASFVMAILVAIGLVVAIGFVSPDSLDTMPEALVNYLPKALVAGLTILVGQVAATLAGIGVKSALLKATGEARPGPARLVKAAIVGAASILAVSQLGVNTTIINLAVAALLFSVGAIATLLIGLGGLDVARNISAGRYVRRILPVGCKVESGSIVGTVQAVHPATVEIAQADGVVVHVPHAQVLSGAIRVHQQVPANPANDASGGIDRDSI